MRVKKFKKQQKSGKIRKSYFSDFPKTTEARPYLIRHCHIRDICRSVCRGKDRPLWSPRNARHQSPLWSPRNARHQNGGCSGLGQAGFQTECLTGFPTECLNRLSTECLNQFPDGMFNRFPDEIFKPVPRHFPEKLTNQVMNRWKSLRFGQDLSRRGQGVQKTPQIIQNTG